MIVDDLTKIATDGRSTWNYLFDIPSEVNGKTFKTPESKLESTCGSCKQMSKTLSNFEKIMTSLVEKAKHIPGITKDLQEIFNEATDSDTSDSVDDHNTDNDSNPPSQAPATAEDASSQPDSTVARRVKNKKRQSKKPAKYRSPVVAIQKRKRANKVPQQEEQKDKKKGASEKEDYPNINMHGLTAREKAAIQYVTVMCSAEVTKKQIIFRTSEAAVMAEDMECLSIDNPSDASQLYLCNRLIDAYGEHLRCNIKDKSQKRMVCLVIYGFLFSDDERVDKCLDPDVCHIYLNIVTQFFLYELVFFPIQVKNGIQQHWITVVMNTKKERFQVLDSLWNLDTYKQTICSLRFGIARLTNAARAVMSSNLPNNIHSWEIEQIEDVPRQKDGVSCGLFVMKLNQHWDGNSIPRNLTQSDIDLFRKKLVAELLFSNANMIKKSQDEVTELMSQMKNTRKKP